MTKFLDALDTLMGLREVAELSPAQMTQAEQCRADMEAAMWHHILIPVSMGNGNSDLGHKFICIAHALRIETTGWLAAARLCKSIISITSDYGVEHQIGNIAFDGLKLLSHWREGLMADS